MDAAQTARMEPGSALEGATLRVVSGDAPDAELVLAGPPRVAVLVRGAPSPDPRHVVADLTLRGNAFRPVHESPRALAALVSIAAGRRMESGPESERAFVHLRGRGLVFLENGETQPFQPGFASLVPAGEAVRLWAQGPEDVLALVVQPRTDAPAPRRTLAGEIARRRVDPPA